MSNFLPCPRSCSSQVWARKKACFYGSYLGEWDISASTSLPPEENKPSIITLKLCPFESFSYPYSNQNSVLTPTLTALINPVPFQSSFMVIYAFYIKDGFGEATMCFLRCHWPRYISSFTGFCFNQIKGVPCWSKAELLSYTAVV